MKISEIKAKVKEMGWTPESPEFWEWHNKNVEDYTKHTRDIEYSKKLVLHYAFGLPEPDPSKQGG